MSGWAEHGAWAHNDFVETTLARFAQQLSESAIQEWWNNAQFSLVNKKTESPLEAAFAAAWAMYDASPVGFWSFYLEPQVLVDQYRLDFQVHVSTVDGSPSCYQTRFPKLCIELDGHDFHEKTQDQISARNERDRYLLGKGWQVLRYSGSEFYRDPFKCVKDAFEHADRAVFKLSRADTLAAEAR